jgi:predicted transcriptional regulator
VFAALADPTRRWMLQSLLRERSTSVPALAAELPISRQAVAKHIATLDEAGLLASQAAGARSTIACEQERSPRPARGCATRRRHGTGGSHA